MEKALKPFVELITWFTQKDLSNFNSGTRILDYQIKL